MPCLPWFLIVLVIIFVYIFHRRCYKLTLTKIIHGQTCMVFTSRSSYLIVCVFCMWVVVSGWRAMLNGTRRVPTLPFIHTYIHNIHRLSKPSIEATQWSRQWFYDILVIPRTLALYIQSSNEGISCKCIIRSHILQLSETQQQFIYMYMRNVHDVYQWQ